MQAFDPETGKSKWKFQLTQNGNLIALDAANGKPLWHFGAGAEIASSPMSYAMDGRQYIAISSAGVLYSFALPLEIANNAKLPTSTYAGARSK